jgi:hypothetical protein
MEAICSSETSVDTQRTTRRHIPEDDTLHNHRCGNLKFNHLLFADDTNNKMYNIIVLVSRMLRTKLLQCDIDAVTRCLDNGMKPKYSDPLLLAVSHYGV